MHMHTYANHVYANVILHIVEM